MANLLYLQYAKHSSLVQLDDARTYPDRQTAPCWTGCWMLKQRNRCFGVVSCLAMGIRFLGGAIPAFRYEEDT